MIRRSLFALAAATAAILLSAVAAQAYVPPATDTTVSDTSPTVGSTFTVQISGPVGSEATLQIEYDDATVDPEDVEIAGVRELSKTIPGSGTATFSVTLNAAGTFTLTSLVDGDVIGTQTVTVRSVGAGGDVLSDTGVSALPYALGAAGLVALGAVTVVAARRRNHEKVEA